MNIVFISNRLAVVWANLYPPAVATWDTARAKTEPEFSCCELSRAQTLTPAERGDAPGMCCPQTRHSSVTFSCYPVQGSRGHAPSWPWTFLLDTTAQWISAPEAWWFKHQLCGSWVSPRNFPKFSPEQPCPVFTFGPTLKKLGWRLCDFLSPHSAFCSQTVWFFLISPGRSSSSPTSKNFLSFLQFPCGFAETSQCIQVFLLLLLCLCLEKFLITKELFYDHL